MNQELLNKLHKLHAQLSENYKAKYLVLKIEKNRVFIKEVSEQIGICFFEKAPVLFQPLKEIYRSNNE